MTRSPERWKRGAPRKVGDSSHTCRCGKQAYRSRKEARTAIRACHPGEKMRAYQCAWAGDFPAIWHIGHLR